MKDWTSYLRGNLDLPAMRGNRDERAIRELADHLEDLCRDALRRGCTELEAEAAAVRSLGDPGKAASDLLATEPGRTGTRVDRWLEQQEHELRVHARGRVADGLRDVRRAVKTMARRPLFSGVAVLVLALGIGATTALFTLVHAIVLSPLPFDEPDRLVALRHTAPTQGIENAGQCAAWHFTYEDENRVFASLGMFGGSRATVTELGTPEAVPTLDVTQGVFPTLRLDPVVGRHFRASDHDPDGPATIMLGFAYWQSRFGGDPHVVGRTLQVDGTAREIIGVMPRHVQLLGRDPVIIRPLRFQRSTLYVGNLGYGAVARLKDGVTVAEASADLARMLPMAWAKFPGGPLADSSDPAHYQAELRRLKDELVGPVSRLLWILLGGVGIVLLIAVANVANLMLVHFDARRGELAVRTALGAGRGRIVWEHLKDSLPLALAGGAVGLGVGQLGLRILLALGGANLPRVQEVSLGPTVILVAAALAVGCGLLLGWLPSRQAARRDPIGALKEGGRSRMRDRAGQRTRDILAVGQVALVLVLLAAGGLMLRSFRALARVDPGFHGPDQVLALQMYIPRQEVRGSAEVAATYEAIVRRLEEVPGVRSAALASAMPMDRNSNVNPLFVEGRRLEPSTNGSTRRHKWIAGGYLETLQIELLAGRSITWDDVHDRAPVALLSSRLARELFGSPHAALGQRIAARPDPPRWKEVVGVVADVHEDGMDQDPPALVYWPHVTLGFWQGDDADSVQVWRAAGIALRSNRTGTPELVDAVRRAVWEVNPNLPVMAEPLRDLMAASTARTAFATVLLNVASGVGLILGCVGVFGVISYSVTQRTGEIGMRIVLGAGTRRVQAMVLRQGLLLAAAGVGVGLAVAIVATRLMSSLLFGVRPGDPTTLLVVASGLIAVSLLASYLPARKAASVDPVVAVRAE